MPLRDELDYLVKSRIRPAIYSWLSRRLEPERLARLLAVAHPRRFKRDLGLLDTTRLFIANASDRRAQVDRLRSQFPFEVERTLLEAERARKHIVDFLGSGPVALGRRIDWHRDFKSGYRWEPKFYRDIETMRFEDDSDIKVPWELSRFQHTIPLGQAYWITGDEAYAEEFVHQLRDWIEENPPGKGINWTSAMEVALRLANWILAFFFFRSSPHLTGQVRAELANSILWHQMFIFHNLELAYKKREGGRIASYNGNHYLSNLLGLILPGLVFPAQFPEELSRASLELLYRELDTQFEPDGVHYELSTSYHRLTMELLLAILLVLRKNGVGYSRRLDQTVAGMTRFVSAYIKPDGTALQLRDGDDGRLFPFSRASIRDHRYLLGVAAHLLAIGEPGDGVELTYEALWWLGSVERADDSRSVAQPPSAARRSYAFPFSGFYFASSADGDYLASCCAGVGMRGLGGHGHNDALSFVLFTGGRDVLVDPGTYVYSADPVMRDRFRSVSYHNTARVDGREMNDILPGRMFSLLERARPKVHRWVDSERCALLIASHAGYSRPGHSLVHRRSLLFCRQRRYWKVNDRFIGDGTHFVEIFFHLATGLKPEACDDPSLVIASDGNRFRFGIFLENPSGWQVDASEAWVSPSYGVKNPSWILRFSRSAPLPVSAKFTLRTVTG